MQTHYDGGFWSLDHMSLDFYYTASAGAEFTNYRLSIQTPDGPHILDPIKSATFDQDSDADDTFMNTVYSLYGLGPASYNFSTYKPIGIGAGSPPISVLDWSVSDTGTGDTNSFDAGPPYGVVNTPFHLARVLVDPNSNYSAAVQAFDTQSVGGTSFNFSGPFLTQPAVGGRSTTDIVAGTNVDYLFKALAKGYPELIWSNFAFSGPGAFNAPNFDINTQQFTWDSTGAAPGTYVGTVKVQGFLSPDTASLTIHVVPEPAILSLICVALSVGLLGSRRPALQEP